MSVSEFLSYFCFFDFDLIFEAYVSLKCFPWTGKRWSPSQEIKFSCQETKIWGASGGRDVSEAALLGGGGVEQEIEF